MWTALLRRHGMSPNLTGSQTASGDLGADAGDLETAQALSPFLAVGDRKHYPAYRLVGFKRVMHFSDLIEGDDAIQMRAVTLRDRPS